MTTFNGQNICEGARKLCTIARAVVEQPRLLLICEKSLDFGQGIVENFKCLSHFLPQTTIMSITHKTDNIYAYDKVILLDNGTIVEKGKPSFLLSNSSSYLLAFMKESNKKSLRHQQNMLSVAAGSRIGSMSKMDNCLSDTDKNKDQIKIQEQGRPSTFKQREQLINETPVKSTMSTRRSADINVDRGHQEVTIKRETTDAHVYNKKRSASVPGGDSLDQNSQLIMMEMALDNTSHKANEMPDRVFKKLQDLENCIFRRL